MSEDKKIYTDSEDKYKDYIWKMNPFKYKFQHESEDFLKYYINFLEKEFYKYACVKEDPMFTKSIIGIVNIIIDELNLCRDEINRRQSSLNDNNSK